MKYFIKSKLLVLMILFCSGCSSANPEYLIEKNNVAGINLGDTKSYLLANFGSLLELTHVNREGDELPALRYCVERACILAELDDSDKVWAIRISSDRFETASGIGVGSTFNEVKEVYPKSDFMYGPEGGGYISIFVHELNAIISFGIDKKQIDKILAGQLEMGDVMDNKVEEILVHNLIMSE